MIGSEAVASCRRILRADLHAGHGRHHQVEDHEVRLFRIDRFPGFATVKGLAHGKSFPFEVVGDQLDDILFVVGNEDLLLRHGLFRHSRCVPGTRSDPFGLPEHVPDTFPATGSAYTTNPSSRIPENGKMERHRRAVTQRAVDADPSPVGLHQVLDDRKPKPGTAHFPGTRLVRPVEPLSQPGNFTLRDADARIGDPDGQKSLRTGRRRNGDFPAGRCEFDGIVQDIEQNLHQPILVRPYRRESPRGSH